MKQYFITFILAVMLSGCSKYSKVIQLTPQRASGWELSHELSISKCNDVDVLVYPVIIGHEGSGVDVLFMSVTSDKRSSSREDDKPYVTVTFKHWYRNEHIESCSLDFVEIENEDLAKRIKPISVEKFTAGEHVTKYSTICTYSFNSTGFSGTNYNLHISEDVLGCQFKPIPSVYERKTKHFIYELM